MDEKTKPLIMCVDDEPHVLEGLALTLRRRYEMLTATSGAAGLELLAKHPDVAVVMSDMRMPGMNGAAFLAQARQVLPNAVRLLLTGHSDIEAAIAAVNEGQIFRFLTKPCAPPQLLAAMAAAVEQNRLITAERVLLEQTLHGAIKTLTDVLSLTNPVAFGRATRIKKLVTDLATKLGVQERWQVEVAAMLSQIGHITLPAATAEKVYFGQPLSPEEQKLVDALPGLTERLLGNIPRLEAVREILAGYSKPRKPGAVAPEDPQQKTVYLGAQMLKLAVDYDALETEDQQASEVLGVLRARGDRYEPSVLAALVAVRGGGEPLEQLRELRPAELEVGMILTEDVKLPTGVLLVARGYEVTPRFLECIRNLPRGALKDRLRVLVRVEPS